MLEQTALHSMVLDSLEEQIAVINLDGIIIYVNRAWKTFGIENGMATDSIWIGGSYLDVCKTSNDRGDSLAKDATQGLQNVMTGKQGGCPEFCVNGVSLLLRHPVFKLDSKPI